jgi:hypothetical protein
MKKLRYYFIFFVFALNACAHVSEMKKGIVALEGKPITEATDLLGDPNEIKKGKDFDSYIWDYQYQEKATNRVRTKSSAPAPGAEKPFQSKSTISCFIKLDVDNKGIIKGWHYKGDQQGCGRAHTNWIQKLDSYAKAHPVAK